MERHRLTGFQTKALWDSETGPLATFENPHFPYDRFPPGFGTTKAEKRKAMRALLAARTG